MKTSSFLSQLWELDSHDENLWHRHHHCLQLLSLEDCLLPQAVDDCLFFDQDRVGIIGCFHPLVGLKDLHHDDLAELLALGMDVQLLVLQGELTARLITASCTRSWRASDHLLSVRDRWLSQGLMMMDAAAWLSWHASLLAGQPALAYDPTQLLIKQLPGIKLGETRDSLHLMGSMSGRHVRHFPWKGTRQRELPGLNQGCSMVGKQLFRREGKVWQVGTLSIFTPDLSMALPRSWTEDKYCRPLQLLVNMPLGLNEARIQTLMQKNRASPWGLV
ncbi:MAG: hypothetical protein HKM02_00515 [Pseudomonadales bacterium]|nr:hypothetical protein [Pseudomonadales bacterium]